jgi:predicted amidohydrolase
MYTHMYLGNVPMLDQNNKVREYLWQARKRGVLFDVGHGGGSFVWWQAAYAVKQGFTPDSISTRPSSQQHERRHERHAQRDVEVPGAEHVPR